MNKLVKLIDIIFKSSDDVNGVKKDIIKIFRSLVGKDFVNCAETDASRMFSSENLGLSGSNSALTDSCLLDAILLVLSDRDSEVRFSTMKGEALARGLSFKYVTTTSFEGALNFVCEDVGISDVEIEGSVGESVEDTEDEVDFPEDKFPEDELDDEESTGDLEKEPEEEKKEIGKVSLTAKDEEILQYYEGLYLSIIGLMEGRYTAQFETGYELIHFAGVLTKDGLAKLSGSSVVKERDYLFISFYDIVASRMGIIECEERSNIDISKRIFETYASGGRKLLYFPYKMLEYVYGRKAPTGDNQRSLNTYEPHSEASNWNGYRNTEVRKSLKNVTKAAVLNFIKNSFDTEEYTSKKATEALKDFLDFFKDCLSVSLSMVEWVKSTSEYGGKSVSMFKLRVCDPLNAIVGDLTQEIISNVFSGNKGDSPFSYECLEKPDFCFKEYAHEFNHERSQASPLFAYKAYLALKEQGIEPSVENMILGKAEDGTIMRNGKNGVSLGNNLIHNIVAGSRAGKGVMTLNILAAGIYSNKAIFYLDNKPDMATIFQHMCSDMFVVNGSKIESKYDDHGFFSSIDSRVNWSNVPDYAMKAFSVSERSWSKLGNLFYLRALKLVVGLIIGRGMGGDGPEFNGSDGIMFVVDEFSIVQDNISDLFEKILGKLPPIKFEECKSEIMGGALTPKKLAEIESSMKRSYSEETMYAISWINSISEDLNFIDDTRRASFSDSEKVASDIFIIGQDINRGVISSSGLSSTIVPYSTGGRYKSTGYMGVSNEGKKLIDMKGNSFIRNYFTFRNSDAFFGRNDKSTILAMGNKASKAYGRLDSVANNFVYLSEYNEDVRNTLLKGVESPNIAIASKGVYFKPFLVLNANTDTYVSQMKERVKSGHGSPEEVVAENRPVEGVEPNISWYENTGLTNMVGFEGYIAGMGIPNLHERLKKSGDIMNYVVQNLIGYPGTWFDFITDMRPEWLFTVNDIASLVSGKDRSSIPLLNMSTNPVLNEWNSYNDFKMGTNEGDSYDMPLDSNYTDFDFDKERSEATLRDELSTGRVEWEASYTGDYTQSSDDYFGSSREKVFSDEEEIGFEEEDFDDYDSVEDMDSYNDYYSEEDEEDITYSGYSPSISDARRTEGVLRGNKDSKRVLNDEVDELVRRLKELQALGADVPNIDYSGSNYRGVPNIEGEPKKAKSKRGYENFKYEGTEKKIFSKKFDFSDGESLSSYRDVVYLITDSVIETFGGLSNFKSFRVRGGSIFVNNHCYKCGLSKESAKSLPYDLRSEISSGCVAKLYDFKSLIGLRNLRVLEFDNADFVYDYASVSMGYGARLSIDLFFNDIPGLQELIIGRKKFTRNTYKEDLRSKDRDMFYQPRFMSRVADVSEDYTKAAFKGSWAFTKNMATNKKHKLLFRAVGTTVGVAGMTATGATNLGVKTIRKGASGIRKIKNLLGEAFSEYGKRN